MPKVPFTAFFYGPSAVYPAPTGERNSRTYTPMLGTEFIVGNYADLSDQDAAQWNQEYGTQLHGGRYRIVKLSPAATLANIGVGIPLGWALGSSVQSVGIADAGTGYSDGTFYCSSSVSTGQTAAVAQVVISGGAIISAQIINGGGPFTAVPTFSLSELSGGSGASILAQLYASGYEVTTYDASSVSNTQKSLVRAICLTPTITQDQIDNGSAIIVQEGGIAPLLVTTGSAVAAGAQAYATSGTTTAAVTVATAGTFEATNIGYTLDQANAGELIRVVLTLPVLEG